MLSLVDHCFSYKHHIIYKSLNRLCFTDAALVALVGSY